MALLLKIFFEPDIGKTNPACAANSSWLASTTGPHAGGRWSARKNARREVARRIGAGTGSGDC